MKKYLHIITIMIVLCMVLFLPSLALGGTDPASLPDSMASATPSVLENTSRIPFSDDYYTDMDDTNDSIFVRYEGESVWSLLNLLLTILTVVLMVPILAAEHRIQNLTSWRSAATIIAALVAVILFLSTQNVSNKMVLIDEWSEIAAIVAAVQAFFLGFFRHVRDRKSVV